MNAVRGLWWSALLGLLIGGPAALAADDAMTQQPQLTIDLGTHEGVALFGAQWRYSDTRIIQVAFHDPGADGQPTGGDNMTYDYLPKAGARTTTRIGSVSMRRRCRSRAGMGIWRSTGIASS
jgi:hypothetical protein